MTMDLTLLPLRLRQNKDKILQLTVDATMPTCLLNHLIDSLRANESLMDVHVLCYGSFGDEQASFGLWESLMEAILQLPRLRRLVLQGGNSSTTRSGSSSVDNDVNTTATISLSCFSRLVSSSRMMTTTLISLTMSNLLLRGNVQDFADWIQQQTALRELCWVGMGLVDDATNNNEDTTMLLNDETSRELPTTALLQPLLQATATLPLLENLEISETVTPLGVLQEEHQVPLGLFQSHPTLKRLSISDVIFTGSALATLLDAVACNPTLEELALSVEDLSHPSVAPHFSKLWKSNKTLRALALRLDTLLSVDTQEMIVRALNKASSQFKVMSLCSFCGTQLHPTVRQALCRVLETRNDSLEYLHVPVPYTDTVFWDQVKLYLGLNAAGRHRLGVLQSSSLPSSQHYYPTVHDDREEWFQTLLRVRSDMSSCFYLISANPDIFCNPVTTASSRGYHYRGFNKETSKRFQKQQLGLSVSVSSCDSSSSSSSSSHNNNNNNNNSSNNNNNSKRQQQQQCQNHHQRMLDVVRMTKRQKLQEKIVEDPTDVPTRGLASKKIETQ